MLVGSRVHAATLQRTEYLDEFMIAHRNRALAAKAWYREQDCYCNERYLNEFKAGFLQGYSDIANGADGCAAMRRANPVLGWKYQSPGGQAAVDAWFAGYPIGVKAAEQDGVGHWGTSVRSRHTHVAKPQSQNEPEQLPTTPEGIEIQNGQLMGPNGPVEEMIVPGSTRIIPAEELQRALEAETLPPVPTADGAASVGFRGHSGSKFIGAHRPDGCDLKWQNESKRRRGFGSSKQSSDIHPE